MRCSKRPQTRYCLELEDDVLKNLKYEDFLELVKETSDDFSEIQDLVTRFGLLPMVAVVFQKRLSKP